MSGKLVCVDDYKREAAHHLPSHTLAFVNGGADDEVTVKENESAFRSYWLIPRVLRNVSNRQISTTFLGQHVSSPIGIAPTGSQGSIHHEAELGTARAAAKAGAVYIQSNWSNKTMREISEATPGSIKWFQLTGIPKQRHLAAQLVKEAEMNGFKALVVTVDVPVVGRRRATLRNPLQVPPGLYMPHILEDEQPTKDQQLPGECWLNPSATFADITWIKGITNLPILIKGILSVEDAKRVAELGFSGIIISNKGGRGADTAVPTIHALAKIAPAVKDKLEIYIDSGIRCGTDVFKALALGAKGVFIGRAALWGLAVNGQHGVEHIMDLLNKEFEIAMALSGCCNVTEINKLYIVSKHEYLAKL